MMRRKEVVMWSVVALLVVLGLFCFYMASAVISDIWRGMASRETNPSYQVRVCIQPDVPVWERLPESLDVTDCGGARYVGMRLPPFSCDEEEPQSCCGSYDAYEVSWRNTAIGCVRWIPGMKYRWSDVWIAQANGAVVLHKDTYSNADRTDYPFVLLSSYAVLPMVRMTPPPPTHSTGPNP